MLTRAVMDYITPILSGEEKKSSKLFVGQWHKEMQAIMDAVHSQVI